MTGLSRTSFDPITDDAHLEQSIGDILSTPLGTRVLNRGYGSNLPNRLDAPMNGETIIDIVMDTAEALAAWEPRFMLERVEVTDAIAGRFELLLSGQTDHGAIQVAAQVGAAP
ncbi:MAG: GPW/gp25 family protein [Pseudomonadota bacterium]